MSSYHDQNFRTSKTSYKLSLSQFIASETLSNSLKELTYTKIAKKRQNLRNQGLNLASDLIYIPGLKKKTLPFWFSLRCVEYHFHSFVKKFFKRFFQWHYFFLTSQVTCKWVKALQLFLPLIGHYIV